MAAESSLNLKEKRERERKKILEPEGSFEDLDSLFLFRQMHKRTAGLPGRSCWPESARELTVAFLRSQCPVPWTHVSHVKVYRGLRVTFYTQDFQKREGGCPVHRHSWGALQTGPSCLERGHSCRGGHRSACRQSGQQRSCPTWPHGRPCSVASCRKEVLWGEQDASGFGTNGIWTALLQPVLGMVGLV